MYQEINSSTVLHNLRELKQNKLLRVREAAGRAGMCLARVAGRSAP